jgi:tetratricopeptide (TPR) repeat protein
LVEQCLADWQPQALKDIRKALLGASLLTRTRQGMYELHQLLREFFALKLAEMDKREEFTTKFAQVLTEVAKTIPQTVTLEWQTQLIELIPHLAAATEFSQYLEGVDKLWCCIGLSRFYQAQSQFKTVELWNRKSLNISKQELGANHLDTASSLNNLASLYESTGRYAEAEPLYVRSLAISKQELGANHPDTAISLNNLVGFYESTDRYAEAEPLYVRALEILEQSLGTNHPTTQTIRENLQILWQTPAIASTSAASMTWVEWLVAIPLLPFYLAYQGLRRVGKIVAILVIMPIVPFWWGYRQLRFLWLSRRRKIRRRRRG